MLQTLRYGLALLLAVIVGWTAAAAAEPPAKLKALILLRAIAYESGFAGGSGEAVIAIVGPEGNRGADELHAVFQKISQSATVADRKLHVVRIIGDKGADISAQIKRSKADVVVLGRGVEAVASAVAAPQGSILVCSDASGVGKGCVLGVGAGDGSGSKLVIDLPRAKAAGLRFNARMLALARVLK